MAGSSWLGRIGSLLRACGRGLNFARLVIINVVFFGILLLFLGLGARSAPEVGSNTALWLRPAGKLIEQYSGDPTVRALAQLSSEENGEVQVRDLVAAIDHAAKDPRIARILLDPSRLRFGGMAALEEVGAALDRFRAAGKPVIAWGYNLEQMQYLLAVHADQVYLDPDGSLSITGLSDYRSYYKALLDKLGVSAHLFRVGEFKSAAEPFILDAPSAASLQADRYWMGGLWDSWLDEVARRRKRDPGTLARDIAALPTALPAAHGDSAQLALDQHWIDGLATRDDIVKLMQKDGVVTDQGTGFRAVSLADYLPQTGKPAFGKPLVAVVVAEGDIVAGSQQPGKIGGESTANLIRAARANPDVRAIVLRVNSPGGQVMPAEQIRREVVLAKQTGKPVIVSMGDLAASGGYWISMDANRIFAEPDTITGSIGIFGLYLTASDGLAKLGIHTGGQGTTPLAGAFDFRRPLDPALTAMVQSGVDHGYQQFIGRVAKARGKTVAAVDAIAQGRVWSGAQAKERGLVDQLGGLHDAIAWAAKDAKLGQNYAVRYAQPPLGTLQKLLLGVSRSASVDVLAAVGVRLPAAWWVAAPSVLPRLEWLRDAVDGKPKTYAYCFCTL